MEEISTGAVGKVKKNLCLGRKSCIVSYLMCSGRTPRTSTVCVDRETCVCGSAVIGGITVGGKRCTMRVTLNTALSTVGGSLL